MQNSKKRRPIPLAIRTHKVIYNTTEPSNSTPARFKRLPPRKVPKNESN